MRFKGTLILLALACALGGFIYFYEIKGGEQREKAKESENKIWKIEEKDIQQITLVSSGQQTTAVRRGDREWALTAPRALDADSDELNRLANSATTLQRESVVEQNATDPARFGLEPPQFSLKLKTKDGKEYAVDFGNNNPTGSSTYAAFPGQKTVFMVSLGAASAFNKKIDEVRNHSVLSFEQPTVQSLLVKNPKGSFEITKDNTDRWWFQGPDSRAADGPEVRGILNALSMGRIKEFFNEDPADYTNLDLDKPQIEVTLTYGKDRAIKRLIIGQEKSKLKKKGAKPESQKVAAAEAALSPEFLAKDAARTDLFFVEKDLVDKLLKSANDVRDKALTPIQRWDVDSITITNTKGSLGLKKSGGEWFVGEAKKKAKWDAVNGILDAMEKPVKNWIDKPGPLPTYGLDKPAIHVVLKQGGSVLADCAFGKSTKDGIYAQVKGDSAVKVADPEGLSKLDLGELDVVEATAAAKPKN